MCTDAKQRKEKRDLESDGNGYGWSGICIWRISIVHMHMADKHSMDPIPNLPSRGHPICGRPIHGLPSRDLPSHEGLLLNVVKTSVVMVTAFVAEARACDSAFLPALACVVACAAACVVRALVNFS